MSREKSPRGFAAMTPEMQRDLASRGGKAAHAQGTAHEFSPDEAREAGKKGGAVVSRDRAHMAAIGRKGGARVSADREHMAAIGRLGGEAVSADREHMAEIGGCRTDKRRGGAMTAGEFIARALYGGCIPLTEEPVADSNHAAAIDAYITWFWATFYWYRPRAGQA